MVVVGPSVARREVHAINQAAASSDHREKHYSIGVIHFEDTGPLNQTATHPVNLTLDRGTTGKYAVEEQIQVTVIDNNSEANKDTLSIDSVVVHVTNQNHNFRCDLGLSETGPDTGTFTIRVTIVTPGTEDCAVKKTLPGQAGDDLVFTYVYSSFGIPQNPLMAIASVVAGPVPEFESTTLLMAIFASLAVAGALARFKLPGRIS